jgi:hypothetical protein
MHICLIFFRTMEINELFSEKKTQKNSGFLKTLFSFSSRRKLRSSIFIHKGRVYQFLRVIFAQIANSVETLFF